MINYSNNGFGPKSVAVLSNILKKKPPMNHLKEFRISNIKSSRQTIQQLFETLENGTNIRKLRLAYLDIKSDSLLGM